MNSKLKEFIKIIIGSKGIELYKKYTCIILLILDYYYDFSHYIKHSLLFNCDTIEKIEATITLRYHSIEKGLLHSPLKYRFGYDKIKELIFLIDNVTLEKINSKASFQSALICLCNYYEIHLNNNIDIHDFFPKEKYLNYKKYLIYPAICTKYKDKETYFSKTQSNFLDFSNSRASVRDFSESNAINLSLIKDVINLANNAPSVCNRQSTKIIYITNQTVINELLSLQGGLTGYTFKIRQVIVLATSRNYFYSTGERNQLFIDGGIYLMNLLYALHFYNLVACPAHWARDYKTNIIANKLLAIPDSYQIISIIPIGLPQEKFKTTLSLRKKSDEVIYVID